MKAIANQNNVHISPRKAKLVVDLIRNKNIPESIKILQSTNKKASPIVLKLLKSAVSNAINNHALDANKLYVYEIFANEGPTWKRQMTRAKGSADRIFKRTTNFRIVLSDDVLERQNDLQKIKDLIKKRALGNSKKKEGEIK